MNHQPKEFELKYIVNDKNLLYDELLSSSICMFKNHGFQVVSFKKKQNCDEYYDTRDMDLYKSRSSLRIRKVYQDGQTKIKATCKMPLKMDEVYASRIEIEETLPNDSFKSFKKVMSQAHADVDFDQIWNLPILQVKNDRTDVILEKNGIQVCVSFDLCRYTNHVLDDTFASDKMVEIELVDGHDDSTILNEINEFIKSLFKELTVNKQSKYERGIDKTLKNYNNTLRKNTVGDDMLNFLLNQNLDNDIDVVTKGIAKKCLERVLNGW